MEWQEKARSLAFGQKRKVPHCGPDATAYISNKPAGLSLYCFRCGESEFVPHGRLSASDILAMRQRDEEEAGADYPDVTVLGASDVPTTAHLWVLRAGITPERATEQYGFGWSDKSSRIIVPILHNGEPTGLWTGRAIDGRKPKYLMPRGSNGACWYRLLGDRTSPVVVVEDVLSAIKVSEAGYSSLAVLGTTVGLNIAALLDGYRVVGWFDGDKAGRHGFVKLRKALAPYGNEPMRITTEKDPKLYSKGEISRYIKETTCQVSSKN